jgi:hypothetical protein
MKKYLLLITGILFSLIFIIPQANHFYGIDTIRNYELSEDIENRGYIYWSTSPFSTIGFEPASYPVGGLLLLSELSTILNMESETSILIMSVLFNLVMFILAYLIGKILFNNDYYALMLAIIFNTSRLLISFTTWNYSVRVLIILYIMVIVWILLKIMDNVKKTKYVVLILLFFIIMTLIHRMSGMMFLFIIAFLLAQGVSKLEILNNKKSLFIFLILGTILYILFYYFLNFGVVDERVYINSGDFFSKTISIMYRHSIYIGAAIIFMPLSLLYLYKNGLDKRKIFILLSFLLLIPFIGNLIYTSNFALIIFSIFITMGIVYLVEKNKRKKSVFITFFIILLIMQIVPLFITLDSKSASGAYRGFITKEEYEVANYLDMISEKKYTVVLADDIISDRVTAYSKKTVSLGGNNDMINDDAIIELQKSNNEKPIRKLRFNSINSGEIKKIFSVNDPYFDDIEYYPSIYTDYLLGNNEKHESAILQKQKNVEYFLSRKQNSVRDNGFAYNNRYSSNIYDTENYQIERLS